MRCPFLSFFELSIPLVQMGWVLWLLCSNLERKGKVKGWHNENREKLSIDGSMMYFNSS